MMINCSRLWGRHLPLANWLDPRAFFDKLLAYGEARAATSRLANLREFMIWCKPVRRRTLLPELERLEKRELLSNFSLYNTGVDDQGAYLPAHANDPHYTMIPASAGMGGGTGGTHQNLPRLLPQ